MHRVGIYLMLLALHTNNNIQKNNYSNNKLINFSGHKVSKSESMCQNGPSKTVSMHKDH